MIITNTEKTMSVYFDTKDEAAEVKETLDAIFDKHKNVMLCDLFKIVGISPKLANQTSGWKNTKGWQIRKHKNDFVMRMPMPTKVTK